MDNTTTYLAPFVPFVGQFIQTGDSSAVSYAAPLVSSALPIIGTALINNNPSFLKDVFKRGIELAGKGVELAGKATHIAMVTLGEMTDFSNTGGTKDPLASIAKSLDRLNFHNQNLAESSGLFADQVAGLASRRLEKAATQKGKEVYQTITHYLDMTPLFVLNGVMDSLIGSSQLLNGVMDSLIGSSQLLVSETIKANVLHILANLADQGSALIDREADQKRPPLGRILSVLIPSFKNFESRLRNIEKLSKEEQTVQLPLIFQELSTALLTTLFPRGAEDVQLFHHTIPVRLAKQEAWERLQRKLPEFLFKQLGHSVEPFLEKARLKEELEAKPGGEKAALGCRLFAEDLVSQLFKTEWAEKKLDALPQKIDEKLPGFEISAATAAQIKSFFHQEDPTCDFAWGLVKDNLEALLLKMAIRVKTMSLVDLKAIKGLIQEARNKFILLEGKDPVLRAEEEKKMFVELTDSLFGLLGISSDEDLFGIPTAAQKPLLALIKAKAAQFLLGGARLEERIRFQAKVQVPVGAHASLSNAAQAILGLIRYSLDKGTDALLAKENDQFKVLTPLNALLGEKAKKGWLVAQLYQQEIADKTFNVDLEWLFGLMDQNVDLKEAIAAEATPLLTNQILKNLVTLLDKEKAGQSEFDQGLLMALLPIAAHHLKILNAGKPVSIVANEDQKRQEKRFYKDQTDVLFKLIFPNGKEDLLPMLAADFQLEAAQVEPLWKTAKKTVAKQLPKAIEALFAKDLHVQLFTNLFENIIKSLDKPIVKKTSATDSPVLTAAQIEKQHEMDGVIGNLILEGARFIELPLVERLQNLPGWGKKIFGLEAIGNKSAHAIGAAIRKKFDGELISKTLSDLLPKFAEKKHVKVPEDQKIEAKLNAPEKLKALEKQLAEKSVAFILRFMEETLQHAADNVSNPIIKALAEAVLWVCSFVLFKIIIPLLHLFGIDAMVVNYLHQIIARGTDKSIAVFSQKSLHQEAIFQGVEAVERALA